MLADTGCNRLRGEAAVESDDATGELVGELPIAVGDQAPEVLVLALDPVEAGRVTGPGRGWIDVEDERPVREQAAGHGEVELEHALGAEAARESLVHDRGVDVP